MTFPRNEEQTIQLFKLIQNRIGWRIVHLRIKFPDAIIENRNGKRLTIEFEYLAKNFREHGHNPDGCDLIVCWMNNWPEAPLPVWALKDCAKEEAEVVEFLLSGYVLKSQFLSEYLHIREYLKALDVKPPPFPSLDVLAAYYWEFAVLREPPHGWHWALALATPPGWRKLISESEQSNAD